jgi:molecular chaperone HtpG
MLVRIREFQGHPLKNIANAKFDLPKSQDEGSETPAPELPVESWAPTIDRFKKILRDQVVDVRMTDRLSSSPARLVDPEGMPSVEYQRVFRLLKQEIEKPKKILELNPHHPIILSIANKSEDEEICQLAITQVYEDALLVEGLHPNPASMIERIQKILEAALSNELANKS